MHQDSDEHYAISDTWDSTKYDMDLEWLWFKRAKRWPFTEAVLKKAAQWTAKSFEKKGNANNNKSNHNVNANDNKSDNNVNANDNKSNDNDNDKSNNNVNNNSNFAACCYLRACCTVRYKAMFLPLSGSPQPTQPPNQC
jgi:hypothetical protein